MNNEQLLSKIKNHVSNYYLTMNIKDIHIKKVYELLIENKIYSDEDIDSDLCTYLGLYYEIKKDNDNMMKYYKMAVDLGNSIAMCYLGLHYKRINDNENTVKYHKMAVELGNVDSMVYLGDYHKDKMDYDDMLKYYLKASELGSIRVNHKLGLFYNSAHDHDNTIYYYQKGISLKSGMCMFNLAKYYGDQGDYENMIKYYMMAIEKGDTCAMKNLGYYYEKQGDYENMLKYYLMALDYMNIAESNEISLKNERLRHRIATVRSRDGINKTFCKLDNRLLEQLLPYKHVLNDDNLKILNDKVENKEIEIVMVKYAGMI